MEAARDEQKAYDLPQLRTQMKPFGSSLARGALHIPLQRRRRSNIHCCQLSRRAVLRKKSVCTLRDAQLSRAKLTLKTAQLLQSLFPILNYHN